MEACISGFQLFMYVHAFCMHGNVHECVCGLGLASLMHLCRDWAALPSCVPGPGRAAAVAWLIYQLLSHFRAHSDSLSLYTSLPIHLLGHFTSLLGYQPDITDGFNFFRHSPELHLIISRTKK